MFRLKSNKGMAVITMLGVMLVLFVLAIGFVSTVRLGSGLGSELLFKQRARMAAESGLNYWLSLLNEHSRLDELGQANVSTTNFHYKHALVQPFMDWRDDFDVQYIKQEFPGQREASYQIHVEDSSAMLNVNVVNQLSLGQGIPARDLTVSSLGIDLNDFIFSRIEDGRLADFLSDLLPFAPNLDLSKMSSFLTTRSYSWNYDFEVDIAQMNIWHLATDFFAEGRFQDRELLDVIDEYFPMDTIDNQEQTWSILLNIKDFFDFEDFLTPSFDFPHLFGRELAVFINEIGVRSTDEGLQAFIELYNPYNRTVEMSNWFLNWQGAPGGNNQIKIEHDLNPGEYYVFPDDHPFLTDDQKKAFSLQGSQVILLANDGLSGSPGTVVDVMDAEAVDLGSFQSLAVNQSIERSDPRSQFFENHRLGASSMGFENHFFDEQRAAGLLPFDRHEDLFHIEDRGGDSSLQFDSVSQMRFIYRDSGPWQYLRLRAADVQDLNGNGFLENSEAGDFVLLKVFFFYDLTVPEIFGFAGDVANFVPRISGKININTAPREVLAALPVPASLPLDSSQLAEIIASHRLNIEGGFYRNTYDVIIALRRAGLVDEDIDLLFDAINGLITVQSQVFKVTVQGECEGYRYGVQALVDRGLVVDNRGQISFSGVKVLHKQGGAL